MQAGKITTVALALFVGCLAVPMPEQNEEMSMFFQHADPGARIVGGSEAPAGSHPHMVTLIDGLLIKISFCGGSLLNQRSVLTAAHCITSVFRQRSLSNNLRVTVGTNRWNTGGQTYTVTRNVTHPHYVSATIKNDIGVLITSSNVVLNALVSPIQLTYDYIPGGVPARVAGWGRIVPIDALPATLLEINLQTMDGQDCVTAVAEAASEFNTRAPPVESHIEVCTFPTGSGNCNGDSGSALVRTSDGRQFGITSWGFPCGYGAPNIYVRVSAYNEFIAQNSV